MKLEDDWEDKIDQRRARILIELDMRDGLYEEIVIKMHESYCTQCIDYWKMSFRCFNGR